MHMTVLVPKRIATSTLGASVSVTSHTGITVCSSTWLVHITPVKEVTAIQARLRMAGMPSGFARGSLLRTSWLASGSRRIAALLARKSTALSTGAHRSASVPKAIAPAPRKAPMLKPTLRAEYM